MVKCKFITKEIKTYNRCTVCRLQGYLPSYYHVIPKLHKWINSNPAIADWKYDNWKRDNWGIYFTVEGKAVQSLQDDYSAIIGSRLAESRAKKKAYTFCHTLSRMIAEELNKELGEYAEAMESFRIYINKEKEHQGEILKLADNS